MTKDLLRLIHETGFCCLDWRMIVMWGCSFLLLYLAVFKKFEPLLLVPIGFGALLANLPTEGMINKPASELVAPVSGIIKRVYFEEGDKVFMPRMQREKEIPTMAEMETTSHSGKKEIHLIKATATGLVSQVFVKPGEKVLMGTPLLRVSAKSTGGLFFYIYMGVFLELFPPLIFLGVGALTDFGPLIANPRTLLLGAAAQFGVFATFLGAIFLGFTSGEAGAIGIIGGADGPTSIFLANKLAPHLLSPIAVAAYSYMALIPIIQPPIMRVLTTKRERSIKMKSLRVVTRTEKLLFALMVTILCILLVPSVTPLISMLMLGNFLRECGVTQRLSKTAQNELINLITIFLGTSIGITMTGEEFLHPQTLKILFLGVIAFSIATASGVLMAKLMNLFCRKNLINPLIGSAGVSAVPMAARVSQVEGQKADPHNFLLMHAMGPNVAGIIGTALVAGYFITILSS